MAFLRRVAPEITLENLPSVDLEALAAQKKSAFMNKPTLKTLNLAGGAFQGKGVSS